MSTDHAANDGDADQPSAADTAIPLPPEKPTEVADLDPLVIAQGNIQRSAHIPAQGGDEPEPLCVHGIDYKKDVSWSLKAQALYPDPDTWFTLCEKCAQAYDQASTGGEGQA